MTFLEFFFLFDFDPGRGSTTTFNIASIAPSIAIATTVPPNLLTPKPLTISQQTLPRFLFAEAEIQQRWYVRYTANEA